MSVTLRSRRSGSRAVALLVLAPLVGTSAALLGGIARPSTAIAATDADADADSDLDLDSDSDAEPEREPAPPSPSEQPKSAAPAPTKSPAPEADPHIPYPPPNPRVIPQPELGYSYTEPSPYPSFVWLALQLVPSPEVAIGRVRTAQPTGASELDTKTAFGLRWQLSPVVWSWGTNRRISRWRYLVVDPIARHSGSLELSGTFEYLFGHVDRLLVRPGVRAYLPVVQRGEYLSVSMGTSTYVYDDKVRVAYDVGAYVLFGVFGVQATIAPDHGPLSAIGTFRIRSF